MGNENSMTPTKFSRVFLLLLILGGVLLILVLLNLSNLKRGRYTAEIVFGECTIMWGTSLAVKPGDKFDRLSSEFSSVDFIQRLRKEVRDFTKLNLKEPDFKNLKVQVRLHSNGELKVNVNTPGYLALTTYYDWYFIPSVSNYGENDESEKLNDKLKAVINSEIKRVIDSVLSE